MKFQRTVKVESRIPSVSMADIAFLLFIFFMSTTIFRMEEGMKITLPRAEMGEAVQREHISHIWISTDGTLSINDRIVPMSELEVILRQKLQRNPGLVVGVNCDENAPYALMAEIIDALKTAGVIPVSFTTQPPP
jgi:biopolymer transport protein ExbD